MKKSILLKQWTVIDRTFATRYCIQGTNWWFNHCSLMDTIPKNNPNNYKYSAFLCISIQELVATRSKQQTTSTAPLPAQPRPLLHPLPTQSFVHGVVKFGNDAAARRRNCWTKSSQSPVGDSRASTGRWRHPPKSTRRERENTWWFIQITFSTSSLLDVKLIPLSFRNNIYY